MRRFTEASEAFQLYSVLYLIPGGFLAADSIMVSSQKLSDDLSILVVMIQSTEEHLGSHKSILDTSFAHCIAVSMVERSPSSLLCSLS